MSLPCVLLGGKKMPFHHCKSDTKTKQNTETLFSLILQPRGIMAGDVFSQEISFLNTCYANWDTVYNLTS